VIKKYANRGLYDTSGSRYINLEDVAANQAGGYEQSTTLFLVIGMRDSIGE